MKRLKELTERLGHETSGSDLCLGGHSPDNVEGCDLIVYTSAIKDDNAELAAARRKNIPCVSRSDYLGALSSAYGNVLAVAGTHGKTTVTGMLAGVFGERFPTVHLGGELKNPPAREESEFFITEACEYKRSFLSLKPDLGIILNAELDHTDYYSGLDDVLSAFGQFADRCGTTLYNGDDAGLSAIMKNRRAVSFGLGKHNDFRAAAAAADKDNRWSFNIIAFGINLGRITLAVKGRHNVYNAAAAAAAGLSMQLSVSEIASGLESFTGVKRRMEYLGKAWGADVYTDYAHHPSEIRALIAAIKDDGRLIIVFEPHTYSRTKDLFAQFVGCFSGADEVIFAPVFASREAGGDVGSKQLSAAAASVAPSEYFESYDEINEYLSGMLKDGDTVVFTGAGTINRAGEELVRLAGNK